MINEASAKSGITKNLMVLLHGLGSNGDDLFSLVPFLHKHFPDTHFYSPDGIEECDDLPFGYQWFSLRNRDPHVLVKELNRVAPVVTRLIDQKRSELGLETKDVILLGFSQGAMTSIYLSLIERYGAVVAFSGASIIPEKVLNTNTPVCLIHGVEDDVVPFTCLDEAYEALVGLGVIVERMSIPHLSHSIDMTGIQKAISFIKEKS
jgi:phospholipase/carboxylesterase